MLKLRAEITKHSQPTVVGSPNFETTSETIAENLFKAHLNGVRHADESHVKESVTKELCFIRRFCWKSLILLRTDHYRLFDWVAATSWLGCLDLNLNAAPIPAFFYYSPCLLEKLYFQEQQ